MLSSAIAVIGVGLIIWGFVANGIAFLLPALVIGFLSVMAFFWTLVSEQNAAEKRKLDAMEPKEREIYQEVQRERAARQAAIGEKMHKLRTYGSVNAALLCPHCQTRGQVRSIRGLAVSGTQVIGGKVLTSTHVTKMHCDNCQIDWNVA